MYTLEQIYEALGKIENGGTDGALKNLIATLTALQNAGGALSTLDTQMNGLKFQSTLLMRGATAVMLCSSTAKCHFNPRSSYEERLHSLEHGYADYTFQSTLLMRGATVSLSSIDLLDFIIHFSRT